MRLDFLLLKMTLALATVTHASTVVPPTQPASGPGGADYLHAQVRESVHGEGGTQFWLFQPAEPEPEHAPLILFLHGYSVMDPHGYRGWIEHLVRRGNLVVYPRYQASLFTPAAEFHTNTLAAMKAAMGVLRGTGGTQPDLRRVAAIGHSAGAVGAMNYAVAAKEVGLPEPKAVVVVQPGQGPRRGVPVLPLMTGKKIPPAIRLVVAVGEADVIVGETSARRIWRATQALKERVFVTVRSDRRGETVLRAGHLSPLALAEEMTDALDWFGWWRLADAACASAFTDTPLKLDPAMGKWSDGQPVAPLKIEYSE